MIIESLLWFFTDNLKENDKELRAMLKRVWPKLTKKTLDRVVPKPPSLINNGKLCKFPFVLFSPLKLVSRYQNPIYLPRLHPHVTIFRVGQRMLRGMLYQPVKRLVNGR